MSFALLVLTSSPLAALEVDPAKLEAALTRVAKDAVPKTVCVLGLVGSGSGAVVSPRGLIVTNAHVAAASRSAVMLFSDGSMRMARRRGIDYGRDLAVLELVDPPKEPLPFFELAPKSPEKGSWLAGVGYPGGPRGDARPAFTFGVCAGRGGPENVGGMLDYSDAVTTDLPLFPGNSGGPLVDLEGRLCGINGAVDLQGKAAFSVPVEVVRDRLKTLQRDLILLPGGQRLDAGKQLLGRFLFRLLDPIVDRAMKGRLGGKPFSSYEGKPGSIAGGPSDAPGVEKLAETARSSERNKALSAALGAQHSNAQQIIGRLLGDIEETLGFATQVSPGHAVTASARVVGRRSLRFQRANGDIVEAMVIARDDDLGVALLAFESPVKVSCTRRFDAPVGSLVQVATRNRERAALGVLSVGSRGVSGSQARAMSQGEGLPAPIAKVLERVRKLAKRLKVKPIEALLDQITESTKARQSYMLGSAPRGFSAVLSHDAPLAPSQIGLPLVDRSGALLGVNVANAHFGTSYAVSLRGLAGAFPALGWSVPKTAEGASR